MKSLNPISSSPDSRTRQAHCPLPRECSSLPGVRGMRRCDAPVPAEGGQLSWPNSRGSAAQQRLPPRDRLVSRAPLVTISCCPACPAQRHCFYTGVGGGCLAREPGREMRGCLASWFSDPWTLRDPWSGCRNCEQRLVLLL